MTTVVLWVVAVAATIWIVVPAIAFALRVGGGVRTEVVEAVGPPPVAGRDHAFEQQWRDLEALGYRAAARTIQHGWFTSPTFWHWRQFETTRWLVSPDGRTYANLYRLVRDEPARIAFVTSFDDGGLVRTECPGGATKKAVLPNFWRTDLHGLDAGHLLLEHQQLVDEFERERATRARAATTAEITAAIDAAEAPAVRDRAKGAYFLFWMFAPAALFLPLLWHFQGSGSAEVALGICTMAGISASLRWFILGPLTRQEARAAHESNRAHLQYAAADVDADGNILARKYERLLRVAAIVTSCLTAAWAIAVLWALPGTVARHGLGGALVQVVLFVVLGGPSMMNQMARARGRVAKRISNPDDVWSSLYLFNFIMAPRLEWSGGTLHRVLFGVAALSILLAFVAGQLERKRGQ